MRKIPWQSYHRLNTGTGYIASTQVHGISVGNKRIAYLTREFLRYRVGMRPTGLLLSNILGVETRWECGRMFWVMHRSFKGLRIIRTRNPGWRHTLLVDGLERTASRSPSSFTLPSRLSSPPSPFD